MQTQPKKHQSNATDAVVLELGQADRSTVVMPCGTGKTLVGIMVAQTLAPKVVALFFPSLALIKQTLHAWKYENPFGAFDYLCVCSDQTIDDDEAHISIEELGEGDRVTTDPSRIKQFLANRDTPKILFSTYQSASMIQPDEPIDLAILDEAHRTAGASDNAFAVPLSDQYIPIRKRVFMTATPRHVEADDEDAKSFSMLDEAVYGKISYVMSIADAIEQGIICDYKIVVSITTDDDVSEIARKHNAGVSEAATIASAVAIRSAMDSHGVRKAITFHKTVKSAHDFASDPRITSIIGTEMMGHVNGKQSSAKRDKVMDSFRNAATGMVTNARCLTEGVDVPSVDMVAFLSRKDSITDIVQACGRTLRISEGKTAGHILLPLHVNIKSNETIEQAVLRSGFREVWRVINSMREQDMIVSGSNGRMMALKPLRKANKAIESRLEVISVTSGKLIDEIRRTVHAVSVKRLQLRSWEDSFALLLEAREIHDTWKFADVDPELEFLDVWCETQKKSDRNKTLRAELKSKLANIGFPFNEKQTDSWDASFQHFVNKTQPEGRYTLNRWIGYQRASYKAGKLHPDRIKKLLDAGFVFDGIEAKKQAVVARNNPPASKEAVRRKMLSDRTKASWDKRRATASAPGHKDFAGMIAFLRKNFIVITEKSEPLDLPYLAINNTIRDLVRAKNAGVLSEKEIELANDAGVHFDYIRGVNTQFDSERTIGAGYYIDAIAKRLMYGPSIIPRPGYPISSCRYNEYAIWMRLVANKNLTKIESGMREAIIKKAGGIDNPEPAWSAMIDIEAVAKKLDGERHVGSVLDKIESIASRFI